MGVTTPPRPVDRFIRAHRFSDLVGTPIYVSGSLELRRPYVRLGMALVFIGIPMVSVGGAEAVSGCVYTVGACSPSIYWPLVVIGVLLMAVGYVLMAITRERSPAPIIFVPRPATDPPSEVPCPSCGAGNLRAAAFCRNCARPLRAGS